MLGQVQKFQSTTFHSKLLHIPATYLFENKDHECVMIFPRKGANLTNPSTTESCLNLRIRHFSVTEKNILLKERR